MSTNSVAGTNVPPISFPGIVSGIDYNSIINQLTSLSLKPTVALNASVATLNAANVELVKINNLLSSVQNALGNLSNPNLFDSYSGISSDTTALTAAGTPGVAAIPGTYTISKVQTATSTSVVSSATAGHSITDLITSGPYAGQASNTVPLADSYAAITPSNGSGNLGQVTIDGVSISYNVNSQSLNQIIGAINTAVQSVDSGFSATLVGGTVEILVHRRADLAGKQLGHGQSARRSQAEQRAVGERAVQRLDPRNRRRGRHQRGDHLRRQHERRL